MKQGIHPVYQEVIYKDVSSGYRFLTRSTAQPKEKELWEDGKEYPVLKVEISSASHPFYTGQQRLIDTAGRIDKFKKKYGNIGSEATPPDPSKK
jgi:large subunit ribosomal protein L31